MRGLTRAEVQRVLAVAAGEIGTVEDPPGSNAGPRVEEYLATVHLTRGNPWCAAFVAWVGVTAVGVAWPVPLVGGCATLGEWAQKEHVRYLHPQVGDIGLLYSPRRQRFAHTFFVSGGPDAAGARETIEGNTSGGGSREGWGVFRRRRHFGPGDRFIRIGPV
jgi:hypothetical protein